MKICALIPVYNHELTIRQVVSGAKRVLPVIVVDDGSTDQTPTLLTAEHDVTVLTLPQNQGKAAALKAGFAKAAQMGFTHTITLDADGQHPVEALPAFAAAARSQPSALIVGVRNLKAARAPFMRRLSNALSTFWFKFETGVRLDDTQCGYRVYPLAAVEHPAIKSQRYAYELEVMVKAAWAGVPLVAQAVEVDYAAPTSRLSHFDPWRDFLRVARAHARLSVLAFCVPSPLRALAATGSLRRMPLVHCCRVAARYYIVPALLIGILGAFLLACLVRRLNLPQH